MKVVLASGGFDPLHSGHIEYLEQASRLGDRLVVALNSDAWLIRKKGYRMVDWDSRKVVLSALRFVDEVIPVNDDDGTVIDALKTLRPDVFAKGGDRNAQTTPEFGICATLGVEFVDGLGPKVASSSTIFHGSLPAVEREWGSYRVLFRDGGLQVKVLDVSPYKSTSLQRHAHRSEVFVDRAGSVSQSKAGEWHQLHGGTSGERFIEVQVGDVLDEDDIERAA